MKYLKASSLSNTIFICLLITILCGTMVLTVHYNKLISTKLSLQNNLVYRNTNIQEYCLANMERLENNKPTQLSFFDDEFTSIYNKTSWGFYDLLSTTSIFKNDTVSKTVLLGKRQEINKTALYTTDYDKPLQFSGAIKITGTVEIPKARHEAAYISGTRGNTIVVNGIKKASKKQLPSLSGKNFSLPKDYKKMTLSEIHAPLIQSFTKQTLVVNATGNQSIRNIVLKGNIIIQSNTPITIAATAKLNDIIVKAPQVTIASGFIGNIQIVADTLVELEERVQLQYPSSIFVENDSAEVKVLINNHAVICGGIIINGKTYQGSLQRQLVVAKHAKIIGMIYCYGKTQLQGEIVGSVYSDRFFLETKSSTYENVIQDVSINVNLPEAFIGLPLFNTKKTKHEVIKAL